MKKTKGYHSRPLTFNRRMVIASVAVTGRKNLIFSNLFIFEVHRSER